MNFSTLRHILLCLRYGIGDVVMELPALEALRQAAPQARITALGALPALELLAGDRRVDRLQSVHDWGLRHWGDFGTPAIQASIRRWLEEENFDLVLDPSHAAMGAGEAIWGFAPPIFDAGAPAQDAALAAGENGLAAVKAAIRSGWGIDIPEASVPRLHAMEAEVRFAGDFLRRHRLADHPVGLSPVASSSLKRWPVARFAALGDHLAESGYDLLLFTGPQRDLGKKLRLAMRHPEQVVPVGPLPLRQVAALIAACRTFIGNDTGLMHLAAAVGTPLLAIFGPTSPHIYLPHQVPATALGGRDDCPWRKTTVFGPPWCVTDGSCLAGKRSCIDDIDLPTVRDAVTERLQAPPPHRADAGRSLWPA